MYYILIICLAVVAFTPQFVSAQNTTTNETCENFLTCGDCSMENKCVWCQSKTTCVPGWFYGPNDAFSCADWRWKTCSINLNIIFWVVVGVAAFIIVGIPLLCLCCCFCCQSKRGKSKSLDEFSRDRQEKESLLQSSGGRTPQTDAKREYFREKYSNFKSSNTRNDPFDQTPVKL